jgi:two-component system cell cycle sensor histidine kinase/response regulator CckA
MTDETRTRQQLMDELAVLRQQLADFERAFQASPDPVAITRLSDGLIIQVNEGMVDLIGYSRDEAIGKTTLQLDLYVNPADRQRMVAQVQEQGTLRGFEIQMHRKTGEVHQVVVSAARIEMGGEACLVVTHHDITGRKQVEEALRQSEIRFRHMFEHTGSGMAVYETLDGEDFFFRDFNQAAERIEGIARTDLIGKSVLEVFPGVREFGLFEVFQRVWKTGQPEHHPVALYKDSRIAGWRENYVYKLPSGEIVAIYDDVTERKQAEEALRENEEKYRNLVERANDGICIIQNEIVKYLNTRLVDMWGGSADDVIGQPFTDFVHPDALPVVAERYQRRMAGEAVPPIYEAALRRKDGSRLDVELNAGLITYQGRPANLVIVRDITERKRIEAELVAERTMLRTLINNLPDAIYAKDAQSRFVIANQAVASFMGAGTSDDLLGKTDFDFYPQALATRFYADERRIIESGQPLIDREEPRLDASGRTVWVLTTKVPLRDSVGNVVGIVGIGRYITERKQAEQELAGERELLRTLVDIIPDLSYIKDTQGRFMLANEPLARLMGVEAPEMLLGKTDFDFLPHDTAAEFYADEQRVIQSGQPMINHEEFLVDTTGQPRWHLSTKVPWRDSGGKIIGLVGVGREITERKQAEEALKQSQQRLELALQGADLGWYDWNVQTGDVVVNDRYAEMIGYRVEELQPGLKTWEGLIHPEDRPREIEALQRELHPPFPLVETEYRMRCTDGEWRWILDRGKVVAWDAEGRPLRAAGTHLDITPRKRAEEEKERLQAELLEMQKMKAIGQLTAGMAHHFNNLLTSINGFAELIRLQLAPGDPSGEMADKILSSGQRAAELVNQMLAFSSKQMVMPVLLNLNDVVRQMEVMLRHMGREHVELVTDLAADLWPVKMDPAQVRQIIVSLALNARDAMPKGGRLTIETLNVVLDDHYAAGHPDVQPGPHVRLRISDTGIGMSDEVKQHLFEPFFTTAGMAVATGMGLAAVYGIVRQNKGFIRVDSQLGQGTVVTILIPCASETSRNASGPGQAATALPPGNETILVLEDHQAVLELAQQVLQDEGYQVLAASDGQEALALAAQHNGPIHLLLTDVVMPSMGGREVADRLAAIRPGLKVLYMSGYTGNTIRHHRVRETDVAFLPKPFSPVDLTCKVRQMLDS